MYYAHRGISSLRVKMESSRLRVLVPSKRRREIRHWQVRGSVVFRARWANYVIRRWRYALLELLAVCLQIYKRMKE